MASKFNFSVISGKERLETLEGLPLKSPGLKLLMHVLKFYFFNTPLPSPLCKWKAKKEIGKD